VLQCCGAAVLRPVPRKSGARRRGAARESASRRSSAHTRLSQVKFLESGGARVVPLLFDLPEADLVALLASLNGALFIGCVSFSTPQHG